MSRSSSRVAAAGCAVALAGLMLVSGAKVAAADSVADFYRGRTVNMLVGVSAGGDYDFKMRLVARHISKHIPGNPTIVPQNMLGATGLAMANYLFNVAPKDGSYVGLIQNGLPAFEALDMPGARFHAAKFNWIGSMAPSIETMAVWKASGIRTIDDAKKQEVVTGAVGRTGISMTFPRMLNELLGTKFRIVGGYPGAGAVNLALERGEVSARSNAWSAWKTNNGEWLRNGDLIILLYSGRKPPDLNGVPALEDLVTAEVDRQLIKLVTAGSQFGHPFATSPGVPPERVTALREAFAAMLRDPEFIKDAHAARSDIDPVSGEQLQQIAEGLSGIPEPVKARAKRLYE